MRSASALSILGSHTGRGYRGRMTSPHVEAVPPGQRPRSRPRRRSVHYPARLTLALDHETVARIEAAAVAADVSRGEAAREALLIGLPKWADRQRRKRNRARTSSGRSGGADADTA